MSHKPKRNNSANNIPIAMVGTGLVLLALATVLLLQQSPQTVTATKTPAAQHSVEETFPEIARVSLLDSKTAFDNKEAVFVDVRDASAYAESHIPGALSIPLAELETRLTELDPNQWIITYCT